MKQTEGDKPLVKKTNDEFYSGFMVAVFDKIFTDKTYKIPKNFNKNDY